MLTLGASIIGVALCVSATDHGYAAISLTLFTYLLTTCIGFWRKKRRTVPLMVGLGALWVAGVVLWELAKQHEPFPTLTGRCSPFSGLRIFSTRNR